MDEEKFLEIYYTNVKDLQEELLYERALLGLQETRTQKILSCKMEMDKLRSLAAGLLLRHACNRLQLSYEEEQFTKDAAGKPLAEHFYYNISHAGDYAVIAFGNSSVGVDIEQLGKRFSGENGKKRLLTMANKVLDDREKIAFDKTFINQEPSLDSNTFFMRLWTQKESYAKENGKGIGLDFKHIHTFEEKGFFTYDLPEGYMISVYAKNTRNIKFPVCVKAQEMIG